MRGKEWSFRVWPSVSATGNNNGGTGGTGGIGGTGGAGGGTGGGGGGGGGQDGALCSAQTAMAVGRRRRGDVDGDGDNSSGTTMVAGLIRPSSSGHTPTISCKPREQCASFP